MAWTVFTSGRPSRWDWIGLFAAGSEDTAYEKWQWTHGWTSSDLSFEAPAKPGYYEFRYIPGGRSASIPRPSNTVTVVSVGLGGADR